MKLKTETMKAALAFSLILGLAACAEANRPVKTPQQVWIDAHPTYLNSAGQCMEADDEPCDEDPYDLEDWYESFHGTKAPSKKPSPKPMLTANQPAPKTPGPVKTTKRR